MGVKMHERQEILSKLTHDTLYKGKISGEFHFTLPKDEKAEEVYHALVKEQQLYLYYAIATASMSHAFWDWNSSTRDVIHLTNEWEGCTLKGNNYESFIHLMDDFTKKEVKPELTEKWSANFPLLFAAPEKLSEDVRKEMLIFLCRTNSFHSLRIFFKLHPAIDVNLPTLLREAIGCLHSQTVQTLIKSGANIHDYIHTPMYLDYGLHIFMPVLYYALTLPCDNRNILQREKQQIFWDNPKLQNLIKTLLSLGANPEQTYLIAEGGWPDDVNTLEKTEADKKENVITFAQNIIASEENIQKMSPESWDFLNYIAKLKQEINLDSQPEEVEKNTFKL